MQCHCTVDNNGLWPECGLPCCLDILEKHSPRSEFLKFLTWSVSNFLYMANYSGSQIYYLGSRSGSMARPVA